MDSVEAWWVVVILRGMGEFFPLIQEACGLERCKMRAGCDICELVSCSRESQINMRCELRDVRA